MAQDNDGAKAELPAVFKLGAYECRNYAFAPMVWGNGHRREPGDL